MNVPKINYVSVCTKHKMWSMNFIFNKVYNSIIQIEVPIILELEIGQTGLIFLTHFQTLKRTKIMPKTHFKTIYLIKIINSIKVRQCYKSVEESFLTHFDFV